MALHIGVCFKNEMFHHLLIYFFFFFYKVGNFQLKTTKKNEIIFNKKKKKQIEAPEVISFSENVSVKSDIWAIGCCCIELIMGEPPYFNVIRMSALFQIVEGDITTQYPKNVKKKDKKLHLCLS